MSYDTVKLLFNLSLLRVSLSQVKESIFLFYLHVFRALSLLKSQRSSK
jgi:hypothetical protein